MSKNVLITGITGFMGKFLAEEYLKDGFTVYGSTFDKTETSPKPRNALHLVPCDIRKKDEVRNLVANSNPDIVFHLAAQSNPVKSWNDPVYTMETNFNGTINLFSELIDSKLDPKILVACSSAEYGYTAIKENRPLNENDPLLPVHPYGLSKVCQDLISHQYFENYGIKVIRARIFNTIGPGKKDDIVGDVSQQIAEIIRKRKDPVVKVGNLDTERDMTDVRDQISALIALVKTGKVGDVYNVCSGKSVQMRSLVKNMIENSGKKIEIEIDKSKLRVIDEPLIIGNHDKLSRDCSWEQRYDIDVTLKDSVNFWLEQMN